MTEKEHRELDHIARVFEKFLYAKILAYEGVKAEGLHVVVGPSNQEPEQERRDKNYG